MLCFDACAHGDQLQLLLGYSYMMLYIGNYFVDGMVGLVVGCRLALFSE